MESPLNLYFVLDLLELHHNRHAEFPVLSLRVRKVAGEGEVVGRGGGGERKRGWGGGGGKEEGEGESCSVHRLEVTMPADWSYTSIINKLSSVYQALSAAASINAPNLKM